MARIYDNINDQFREGLEGIITASGVERVDFCVGYFNLRGWNMIVNQIDKLPGGYVYEKDKQEFRVCRLLIGMHRPPEDLVREMYSSKKEIVDADYILRCKMQIAADFRRQLLLGLPTKQDEWTLRRLSSQLKDKKVCVKLYLREPLHAKLYLAHRPEDHANKIISIMGSSNLTYSGFTGQGELNAEFTDSDHAEKLAKWFDERWNERQCLDITEELIKVIDESWASEKIIPPYYIYLKTAYHLSQEARSGIKEFSLTPEFRHELFDFQQTAVQIAARHLRNEKRGGAMIGDVVGLGKTITACAIAKIYETTYASSTLIICPANLQEMWKKYVKKYDLKCDVLSMSKPIDVDSARYYRLVIVDESHNLRNGGKRYNNIKQLIEHQNCNVLLLTATPYNKDYSDLANQLKLFLSEDQDLGIRPEEYIRSVGGERPFMQKHSEVFIRSIKAFEQSNYVEDWNELMKLFLVRRTRTFIKENYAKTDENDGRRYLEFNDGTRSYFPERIPKALKFKTEKNDQYSRLYSEDMIAKMESLILPRYGLINYINDAKIAESSVGDKQLIYNLSRAGNRMMGFCKSTFFKRMDSSGFSFLLTLYRHILRNMVYVYAIENKLSFPIGDENVLPDEYMDDEDINATLFDEVNQNSDVIEEGIDIKFPTDLGFYRKKAAEYYSIISQKNNIDWLDSRYFKRTLKQHLLEDCNKIIDMINLCGAWRPDADKKLEQLEQLLRGEHAEEKVIIFTQYSDTAKYIYRQLRKRGFERVERVTGSSQNPTALVERFSPVSNGADDITDENELRILVATDVLSEGQNLQDSHVIINYDLPWAIIRLIQRAGRVDRIGQKENRIFCYSFFPAEGVENIIKLRKRLNDRINTNAKIVGSDEIFFEGNEQNLRDMFNEKSGVLDDEEDTDVDLSSQAYQIWKNAIDANPKLEQIIPSIPNIAYSTKNTDSSVEQGVITYARTYNDYDILTWLSPDGEIVSQSQKRILAAFACKADTPAVCPLNNHHELVGKAVAIITEQSANTSIGGILGSRHTPRYRIIKFLEICYDQPTDLFFTEEMKNEIKLAINDIYNYPLIDSTSTILGQMMRRNVANREDIVEQVLELRRTGNLCRISEDSNMHKEPQIICSLGLANNHSVIK